MTFLDVVQTVTFVVMGAAAGIAIAEARHARRQAARAQETAEVALDVLELMEQAHDPGRSVHNRLAAAMEASLVRMPDDGPADPDVAGRRAAAQAMAAQFIETCRRADLRIVTNDGEAP